MRTEEYLELHADIELRQHIVDTAKALTGNRKWQKDLVGHAWFMLGETEPQKTCLYYKALCRKCMKRRISLLKYA